MKKLILSLVIVLGIVLTNCSSNKIYDGRIHPSNPKLHNIVVLKNYSWETDNTVKLEYFSFKDSVFHTAIIPVLYKNLYQIGDTIK